MRPSSEIVEKAQEKLASLFSGPMPSETLSLRYMRVSRGNQGVDDTYYDPGAMLIPGKERLNGACILKSLVPGAGLEPTRPCDRGISSSFLYKQTRNVQRPPKQKYPLTLISYTWHSSGNSRQKRLIVHLQRLSLILEYLWRKNICQEICRGILHGINRAQVAGTGRPHLLGSLQRCKDRQALLGTLWVGKVAA